MNYKRIYYQIIENAQNQQRVRNEVWTDNHHILPRSLGGTDDSINLILLTPREHFICHWLLSKFTEGEAKYKMLNALRMMRAENKHQKRYKTKITARVYENLRYEYAAMHSERFSGENNPMYGDKFYRSEEGRKSQAEAVSGDKNGAKQLQARKKIAESKKGKKRAPFTEEWKANLSKAKQGKNNNRYGVEVSDETRKKIGDRIRGRKQTEEEKERRRQANLGKKHKKKHCPHCGRDIAVNTYPRFHGDKCKEKV